jgi:hypothetical protein
MKIIILWISSLFLVKIIQSFTISSHTETRNLSFKELFAMKKEKNSKKGEKFMVYVIHQGNQPLNEGKGSIFIVDFDNNGNLLFNQKGGLLE